MNFILPLVLWTIKVMPKSICLALINVISYIAGFAPTTELKKIYSNLKYTEETLPNLIKNKNFPYQVFRHQLLMFFEIIKYSYRRKELIIDGMDEYKKFIKDIVARNSGFIVTTGHLGCWELVGSVTAVSQNRNFHAMAKAPSNKTVFESLESLRNRNSVESIWTDKPHYLKKVFRMLRNKIPLGFVMDQKPMNREGTKINFLGRETDFVLGPYIFGEKSRAPILGVYCLRVKPFHYKINYKLLVSESDYDQLSENQVTQILADSIAETIKSHPEQWVWNYKRWKI